MWNINAYHRGKMVGSTPNIDRIADEGMIFMDHYAQASCTAGRAAFITGQYPLRTGLSTIGLPDAKEGIQEIADLGPWGQEHQRNLDQEVLLESKRFIKEAVESGRPFFVWHNTTRMHYRTNLNEEYDGKSGYGIYAEGMMELDDDVGELLKLIDELGVADNTIVMLSTDNGAASNSWPDGGNQPFHGEKGVGGWEGGFRAPMVVKWKDNI